MSRRWSIAGPRDSTVSKVASPARPGRCGTWPLPFKKHRASCSCPHRLPSCFRSPACIPAGVTCSAWAKASWRSIPRCLSVGVAGARPHSPGRALNSTSSNVAKRGPRTFFNVVPASVVVMRAAPISRSASVKSLLCNQRADRLMTMSISSAVARTPRCRSAPSSSSGGR